MHRDSTLKHGTAFAFMISTFVLGGCSDDASDSGVSDGAMSALGSGDSDAGDPTGLNTDTDNASTYATSTATTQSSTTSGGESSDASGEVTDGETGGFGCSIEGGGTQDDFYVFELTLCDDHYNVQTNPWGGAEQTITAGGDAVFRVDAMQEPEGGEAWEVATFPSVFRGTSYGGDVSQDSNLPIAVGDITSLPTGLATNASSIEFGGNATYDVYFTHDQAYNGGPPDVYLMVWYFANALNPINTEGEGWSCRSDPPNYIDSCSGAGSVEINGKIFYRFIGPNGEATVISYAPEEPFDTWEYDLKDFIDDAVSQGVLDPAMHLQGVQAGFEITTGGVGLVVEDYYVHVNP